jgi:hypothetical protein
MERQECSTNFFPLVLTYFGMKKGMPEMLTAKEFAERAKVSYPTVIKWLRDKVIPDAKKIDTPRGEYWEIPATALAVVFKRKPGPKPGTKQKKKRASRKSGAQGAGGT